MKSRFNYSHCYDKFECVQFTTIRGKDSIRHYKIGQVVENFVKGIPIGQSFIYKIEQLEIINIGTNTLIADGQCSDDGIFIKTTRDFVKLLNSFRRFHKIKSSHEVVTIFYMRWFIKEQKK